MMTQLGQQSNTVQERITDSDVLETTMAAQMQLQLDLKAEKKVSSSAKISQFRSILYTKVMKFTEFSINELNNLGDVCANDGNGQG